MKVSTYKPTVPEHVADWIEKQDGLDAIHIAVVKALESKNEQLVGWVFENQDEFALAYAFRHKVAKKDEQKELIKIARINKEEYEVLKELDDKWKWIVWL